MICGSTRLFILAQMPDGLPAVAASASWAIIASSGRHLIGLEVAAVARKYDLNVTVIEAMDRVMARARSGVDPREHARGALARIAPQCRWTSGRWSELQRDWNEIQNVSKDIRMLAGYLVRLDHAHAFSKVA